MNIVLIKAYHENMPQHQTRKLAAEYLERLNLGSLAHRRNADLMPEERFCVMLLRAAMMKDAIILIDQPFKMMPHLQDIQLIVSALKKIDDLYLSCHIYDYQWMEAKYGEL